MGLGYLLLVQVELGDVVEEDEEGKEDDADEGHLVDDFLELLVDVAAHDAFDDEEEDHAAVEQGEGHEVEDAELEGDEADEADERPYTHLGGDVDLLGDADGTAHLLDGDVAGEEAFNDAEDQHGTVEVFPEGFLDGFSDGEVFDVRGWRAVGEAEAVLVAGAGGGHLFRCGGEGEGLTVAEDAEGIGGSLVVLEIGEQGVDGVGTQAVDGEELVAGLETGAGGGRVGGDAEDVDGAGIHLGNEADVGNVVDAEVGV